MAQLAAWCISKVMWCKHKWKTLVSGCVRCWLNHILLFPGTPHSDRALAGYLPEDITKGKYVGDAPLPFSSVYSSGQCLCSHVCTSWLLRICLIISCICALWLLCLAGLLPIVCLGCYIWPRMEELLAIRNKNEERENQRTSTLHLMLLWRRGRCGIHIGAFPE